MLWYDMHLQTPQYTTWTIKHHNAPHTHICTTFITIDISVPPNTIIYYEKFYASQCTTCTTKHYHAPHIHICTTCTTIDIFVQQKILCTRKNCMYHMHHKTPPCTTKHHVPPNTTKNKIYLVDLPSTLYERPCQCDRFDVKQLVLWISHEICQISWNP